MNVTHLKLRWTPSVMGSKLLCAASIVRENGGLTLLIGLHDQQLHQHLFSFPCRVGGPDPITWAKQGDALTRWGLSRLGPGVWSIDPSVIVAGELHAFVTLVDVPEPAPFVPAGDA